MQEIGPQRQMLKAIVFTIGYFVDTNLIVTRR